MSGISSSIGLISGIDIGSLVDQLIAIESRPVRFLEQRVAEIDIQRSSLLGLSAQVLAIQNAVASFDKSSFFRQFTSTSTDESVLVATATDKAVPGTFNFRVHSLVTNHSVLSRGFANSDSATVGAGTITFEIGQGRVNAGTDLDTLNGGEGIQRGTIRITDRSGATADIDLSRALTVDDVLREINGNAPVSVRARVTSLSANGASGDRIVIEDFSGGSGNLIIADLNDRHTASDLGIAASIAGDRIDGRDLVRLSASTSLDLLNDGLGMGRVRRGVDLTFETSYGNFNVSMTDVLELDTDLRAVNDGQGVRLGTIRVTDRAGDSAEIDLSNAHTVGDIRDALNDSGLAISATIVNAHFQISDTTDLPSEVPGELVIEDISGFTAADLGFDLTEENGAIVGREVYRIATLGDAIRAINFAKGNNSLVEASISQDGNGIVLAALGFDNSVKVVAGENSTTAEDLGIAGATFSSDDVDPYSSRHLVSGLNTVLLGTLNGGSGVGSGSVQFTDRSGQISIIDFSAANTLGDVVDLINAGEGAAISAAINSSGNGIVLRDESGGTNPSLLVEDVEGTLAADLHISFTGVSDLSRTQNEVNSGNLQRQYITGRTLLEDLNNGAGVSPGDIRITDSNGFLFNVTIPSSTALVGDVIATINNSPGKPDTIEARINDTGDGIIIVDTAGGEFALKIEDADGGQTAANLRLAGTAGEGENFIDGSFEVRIDVDASDTLDTLAAKINNAGLGFSAAVLNDGGANNPFSLTITSNVSGRRGEMLIDSGSIDLGLETLSHAQDAVITVGAAKVENAILITSATNTIDNVIQGVSLDLLAPSDEAVTVTVAQDVEGIVTGVQAFVEAFNGLQANIDEAIGFNSDTLERGPLLGDPAVNTLRTRLNRVMLREVEGLSGSLTRLSGVGLRIASGNRLEFNEQKFRDVYEESPEKVEALFALNETGFGTVIQETLEELSRDTDGLISRRNSTLSDQQELLNDRIADLNILLDGRRARLESQFIAMESALAALQNQQSVLSQLTQSFG